MTERIVLLEQYLHDLAHVKKRRAIDAEGQGLLFEGRSSEVESQADVEDEEETDGEDDDPLSSKRGHKKRSRQKLALSQLPTEERIHELPESERICPETGVPLVKVGEKVVEELHFEPAKLIRILHRHVIYGPEPTDAAERKIEPICAPGPVRPIEDCIASAAFLSWAITQKYCHHLPLYRQTSIFEREGLRIPRSTLSDWVLRSAELLEPIADCLFAKVRLGEHLKTGQSRSPQKRPVRRTDTVGLQAERGWGQGADPAISTRASGSPGLLCASSWARTSGCARGAAGDPGVL